MQRAGRAPRAPRVGRAPRAPSPGIMSAMQGRFAGLDVSTQGCKLVVIDVDAGEVVWSDALNYDRDLSSYGTRDGVVPGLGAGVCESDPRMWIEAVEVLLGRLSGNCDPATIRCIAVAGQMHGLVALDAAGALARPRAKLWNDVSTHAEAAALTAAVGGPGRVIDEVGNVQRAGYTAAKILHLRRHEPEAWNRAALLLVVKDYVNWHLTGGPRGGVAVMEPGDAAGTGLWNPVTGRWSRALLEAIDGSLAARLPEVGRADRTIGVVGSEIAARSGLSAHCRVDAGSGDNMYGALGTGNFEPGTLTVSLGTSGTAATVLDTPWVDPTGEIALYGDPTGRYLSLLCVSNLAGGYNAALQRFGLTHVQFDELMAATPAGNEGRMLVPWFEGERSPDLPLAAPIAFGFGVGDDGPGPVCRGLLEGAALNLQAGAARMPVQAAEIRLTGGLAASPAWRQAIADAFAMPVVPVPGEGASLGAALHAAWVWTRESGRPIGLGELVATFVRPDERLRCVPQSSLAAGHALQRRLFAALTRRLRGLDGEDPFALRAQLRQFLVANSRPPLKK